MTSLPSLPGPDGRAESDAERADRNWNEILQELRVLQTGTQILTGFLLALAFQPAFGDLSLGLKDFYLVLVAVAVLSAIVAMSPVALHRMLFQKQAKGAIVRFGHIALVFTLLTVSLLLMGVIAFVFHVVLGSTASWIAAVALAIAIVTLWVIVPAVVRIRRRAGKELT